LLESYLNVRILTGADWPNHLRHEEVLDLVAFEPATTGAVTHRGGAIREPVDVKIKKCWRREITDDGAT
jgi:hypothetical protein